MKPEDRKYAIILVMATVLVAVIAVVVNSASGKGILGQALSSYVPAEITLLDYIGLALGVIVIIGISLFFIRRIMQ